MNYHHPRNITEDAHADSLFFFTLAPKKGFLCINLAGQKPKKDFYIEEVRYTNTTMIEAFTKEPYVSIYNELKNDPSIAWITLEEAELKEGQPV